MKMLVEYLENAAQFEQMAADEKDPKLKAEFARKAASYRNRAEKRAKEYSPRTAVRREGVADRSNRLFSLSKSWYPASPSNPNFFSQPNAQNHDPLPDCWKRRFNWADD